MSILNFFKRLFGLEENKPTQNQTNQLPIKSESDDKLVTEESTNNFTNNDFLWNDNEEEVLEKTQEREIAAEKDEKTHQRAILIRPTTAKEAKIIAKRLMQNNIVVLNLEKVSVVDFERIKDFVSGTLFSLDGTYRAINATTSVLLPSKSVDEEYIQLVLKKAKEMK